MYNYEILNESLEQSEVLLKNVKESHSKYIADCGAIIKTQICNAICGHLSATKCPNICDITVCVPRIGEVNFSSGGYLANNRTYKYQLFIRNCDKVSRIYFDMDVWHEDVEQPMEKDTMIALINAWNQVKRLLYLKIEETYQARIEKIKTEMDTIESERNIFDYFIL